MDAAPKKILFIDDEPNVLEMLERMIHQCRENWAATFCLNVDDALEKLHHEPFDAVLTDIRMPGKNGLILIETMQAHPKLKHIPVVVLTGESDRTLKRRILELGATDLLNKPVDRMDLIARLKSAVRLKEYEDQLQNQIQLLDRMVYERTKELEQSHREIMWRLAKAGEYRDDETGDHVARVAWLSCILAKEIGMADAAITDLFQASPLHDIGKIGIPDSILLKPGKLTDEERRIMQRHTLIGEEILMKAPKSISLMGDAKPPFPIPENNAHRSSSLSMACVIARCHHEKWDGSGYPDGLAGEAIPMEARIVAVVDVYDALLSERPYKKPFTEQEALQWIQEKSGSHFDSKMVQAFLDNISDVNAILGNYGISQSSKDHQEEGRP